jgi:hypothetical protein
MIEGEMAPGSIESSSLIHLRNIATVNISRRMSEVIMQHAWKIWGMRSKYHSINSKHFTNKYNIKKDLKDFFNISIFH